MATTRAAAVPAATAPPSPARLRLHGEVAEGGSGCVELCMGVLREPGGCPAGKDGGFFRAVGLVSVNCLTYSCR